MNRVFTILAAGGLASLLGDAQGLRVLAEVLQALSVIVAAWAAMYTARRKD